jgi:serine protein kinase
MTMTDVPTTLGAIAEQHRENSPEGLREPRPFDWYLDELLMEPKIARNAHQRVADMFRFYGTEYDEERGVMLYKMAVEDPLNDGDNVFYGREIQEAIHEFVNKVYSASRGLGPEKRIKLLLGPVGSGKSDFDRQIRKYFEDYTSRDEGRMFTFRWVNLCDVIEDQDPSDDTVRSALQQSPVVLLPQDVRDEIFESINEKIDASYDIYNDQRLDPRSAFFMDRLLEYYDDDLQAVLENHIEVVRLVANENRREAIETFEPKDKKNQDETELTGDVNYSKIAAYGESDPRAFDYSGAFCNANRGIFSGEELLKLQKEFLYDFLHATQEQTIKPKNNPRIDIDQVIVGRTNMPEYREKTGNEKMEAFNDRTKRIDFPYVLEYPEEAKIYEKMLRNSSIDELHVEPHTLEMAALFGVMTRLEEPGSENISLLQKAKAYAGEDADVGDIDVEKLREEADEEGMAGVSARFVGDEISEAIVSRLHDDSISLSALNVFNHLEDNLERHGSISADNFSTYYTYIEEAKEEFEERAIEDVRHALAYNTDEIEEQGEKYMDNVMAYIDDDKVEDEITGDMVEPDEQFMRSVEEELEIPRDRKDDFRQEITNWVSRRARRDEPFSPTDNERLLRALERKLWKDKKHNINFSALIKSDSEGNRDEWVAALEDRGYSEEGAEEVLEFAGAKVAKEEMNQ